MIISPISARFQYFSHQLLSLCAPLSSSLLFLPCTTCAHLPHLPDKLTPAPDTAEGELLLSSKMMQISLSMHNPKELSITCPHCPSVFLLMRSGTRHADRNRLLPLLANLKSYPEVSIKPVMILLVPGAEENHDWFD